MPQGFETSLKPRISFYSESPILHVEMETDRLYIRSYRKDDFENCVNLYGDATITKYFDHGKPWSRKEVENLTQGKGTKYFNRGEPFGLFSVFDKKDATFMGQVDLIPLGPGAVEIGCILHKQYHSQGFSMEAIRALISYVDELNFQGFKCEESPISKVIATAHPENLASHRIVKNLGMSFDKLEERFGNPRLWYSCTPASFDIINKKQELHE